MRLTGSRYHLGAICGWAFRPDVEIRDTPAGAKAVLGSEAHAYVHTKFLGLDPLGLFLQPDAIKIGERVWTWVEKVGGLPTHCEIKIVYDAATDTARTVDEDRYPGERNYGPTTWTELPVTLDLLWVPEDGDMLCLRDLKTGEKQYAHREQLVIQALAATRLFKRKAADVAFLWGRKTRCDADALETLDEAALEAAAWEVAAVMTGLPGAQPRTGDHCFFCPARKQGCPAQPAYVPPDPPADREVSDGR